MISNVSSFNLLLIFAYSAIGMIVTYFFSKNYVPFFEKRVFNNSINYLEEFVLNNLEDNENKKTLSKNLSLFKDSSSLFKFSNISFFKLEPIFYFIVLCLFSFFLFSVYDENTKIGLLNLIFYHILFIFLLNIAIIDAHSQWLTYELLFILGLFGIVYFSLLGRDPYNLIIFSIALLASFLINQTEKLSLGEGDLYLFSIFILFFSKHTLLNGFIISTISAFVFNVLFMVCFGFYLHQKYKKLNRVRTFPQDLKRSVLYFRLTKHSFGQWLVGGIIFSFILEKLNLNTFLFNEDIDRKLEIIYQGILNSF